MRVTTEERGAWRLEGEGGAQIGTRLKENLESPAVGDWVKADEAGTICEILPRKSRFIRKSAGRTGEAQTVAANIDIALLVMALNRDFSIRRMERYLALAWESGTQPAVVLTKADLCPEYVERALEAERNAPGVPVMAISTKTGLGMEQVKRLLVPGATAAFLGSSGAGKSTLINALLGREMQETNGLRNDDRGRHTTTRRELFALPGGAFAIDTPGMRELGMWAAEKGLNRTFAEIAALAQECRFRNCTHNGEPGCAVQSAIQAGELPIDRWEAYQKLLREDGENARREKERKFKEIAKINRRREKR